MKKVDLNCDLGESFGRYTLGMDEIVLPFITSANVACGFHASDPDIMNKTVELAKANHVAVGAHPGFPDLVGFGRRNMNIAPKEITTLIIYQIGALNAFCQAHGIMLQHVKPHGALYNMAAKDDSLAEAICEGIAAVNKDLLVLGPGGGKLVKAAEKFGLKSVCEVFADRAYMDDGTLVPRSQPGAVLTDDKKAIDQVLKMVVEHKVTSITGKDLPIAADSICVHGDNEKALLFIKKIREALEKETISIVPMHLL